MDDALTNLHATIAERFGERPPASTPAIVACGCPADVEPTCPARLCVTCCPYAHGDAGHKEECR